jgi:hypothetical protein
MPNLDIQDSNGRFKVGHKLVGSGRPPGSRPKLHALFWDDLYAVWKTDGKAVLERLAMEDPAAFAKIAALLVTKGPHEGEAPPGVTIVNVITGVRG